MWKLLHRHSREEGQAGLHFQNSAGQQTLLLHFSTPPFIHLNLTFAFLSPATLECCCAAEGGKRKRREDLQSIQQNRCQAHGSMQTPQVQT